MKNIVIFASGSGSNAEKIVQHFQDTNLAKVVHIYCNNSEAGVIQRAERLQIPCRVFTREEYKNGTILDEIKALNTDLIVLAGFLWLIPGSFVQAFPQRIINLHPALLPKFGGKGMYGHFVHEAVKEAREKESGITIHYVNEHYDEGNIIYQSSFKIDPDDSPEDIARKGQILEHRDFPVVIEKLIKKL
ncbi:phosphoribosylglycinamide formyltransferase [Aquirufa rosea]|uniref:Phosphoribosylglycinamide formyltransferase n=1 Tax=Aquirufa rosea TaxID=2509241 RepID=A0A4Q1C1C7_9BACT|nr:phosphoribosylglycinamide formyltransferase [Aquirufa rosea]RXK50908.1 phosphoribosylglycinamide formyltransferase [Aquirufa rosea]